MIGEQLYNHIAFAFEAYKAAAWLWLKADPGD